MKNTLIPRSTWPVFLQKEQTKLTEKELWRGKNMRLPQKLSDDIQTFLNKSTKLEDWKTVIQEIIPRFGTC